MHFRNMLFLLNSLPLFYFFSFSRYNSLFRVINRRYIADVTPMESRTAVSATFVTLSAAGTAVGPGLAAVVQRFDTAVSRK